MGSFLSIIFLYFYIINTKTHKIHAPLQFLLLKKKNTKTHKTRAFSNFFVFLKHKNTQNTCLTQIPWRKKTQKHIKHMGGFPVTIFLFLYNKHKNTQNTCPSLVFTFVKTQKHTKHMHQSKSPEEKKHKNT